MLRTFEGLGQSIIAWESDDRVYFLPAPGVPDDPSAGVEEGGLKLTRQDMESIFDPPINETISRVQEQICAVQGQGLRVSVWYIHVFWSFAILISSSRLLL